MNYWLLTVPVISAIIGWAGSLVAAKLLVQGIVARQGQLAAAIGQQVAASFPFTALENKLHDPAVIKKIMPVVEAHIEDFLRHKLKEKMPMIGMLIGDKTINTLKEIFLKEIEEMFPPVMGKLAASLQNESDIQTLVVARLNAVPAMRIRQILTPVMRFYSLVGAIIGAIIGLVDTALFSVL